MVLTRNPLLARPKHPLPIWEIEERRLRTFRVLSGVNLVMYCALVVTGITDEEFVACILACAGLAITAITLYWFG
jgi:hypothetical protein